MAYKLYYAPGSASMGSKDLVAGVPAGTIYVQHAGGGGGFGDPFERPAEKVAAEVRDGIISAGSARDDYGVAVHPRTLELLADETAQLRARKEGGA